MSTRPVLTGELGLLSLFDLSQLLMLNGATGSLHVLSNSRKGHFRFERGQIANAVDERMQEGEAAAYRLFSWRSGTFEFRVEPATGARTIEESTEGLMLEAARRMDEAGGSEDGESVTQALQARAGKFEALREAFQRVASDVGAAGREGGDGARFAGLTTAGDALLYRPGFPVRLLHAGRWQDVGDGVLEPAAFLQLCGTFFENANASEGTPVQSVVTYDGARELWVSRHPAPHDALHVRAVRVGVADAPDLSGDEAAIDEVLDIAAGLVLIGAPTTRAAEQLLHAALRRALARRSLTALLTSERGAWQQEEALGVVLVTARSGLAEALNTFVPDLAAFDVAHADASLEALHRVPLVVCALVAPDAGSLMARWLARQGHGVADAASIPLAGAAVGVLFTPGAAREGEGLPVLAARSGSGSPGTSRAARGGARPEPAGDAALRSVIDQLQKELRDAA